MIGSKTVIKFDGKEEPFDAKKLFRWAEYAAKTDPNIPWEDIALETYKRIPNKVSSSDIHETMIKVLEETKDVSYTRVSARLRIASLRKNMERKLGVNVATDSFEKIYEALLDKGVWCRDTLPPYSKNMEDWWNSNKREVYQSWSVQQFEDKYAVRIDGTPVEVPQLAMLGIGLGLFGDKEEAYQFATAANKKQINLPTPLMNGSRNGDFDTVSCCVVEAEDSVESILAADHIAARMTAKKAGIGVKYNTRAKNADVKGGRVKHLGKHPIFRNTLGSVGVFSQITRGGSATVSVDIIDPEVHNTAIWKSQRSDIRVRLDWLDFSVCFNDYFIKCAVERKPWHFFSMDKAPEIYEAFPTASVEEFERLVEKAVKEGRHHSSTDALELIGDILELRVETGRIYFTNLSRMNEHSPFEDTIRLSNLCQEIALPTKPYKDMDSLYSDKGYGETAFCSLSAIVPSNIEGAEEYKRVAEVLLKAVTQMIKKSPKMTPNMERTMLERMSVGIGISGLAEYLYKHGTDFDGSLKSFQIVKELAELHYYSLLKASIKMVESGELEPVRGVDFNWLPIDTKRSKLAPTLDWESLRGKARGHSVLSAMMPCESSSVFSGTTNGVYPPRSKFVYKKSRKGTLLFVCEGFKEGESVSAWDIDNKVLSTYYALIQDYTDQAISADDFYNQHKYPEFEGKKPLKDLVEEWVAHFEMGNKTMYYTNTLMDSGNNLRSTSGNLLAGLTGGVDLDSEGEECESCTL